MSSSGNLILITGSKGFIATHTVESLLQGGYCVVVVPDMTASGAFDEAVKGINRVRAQHSALSQHQKIMTRPPVYKRDHPVHLTNNFFASSFFTSQAHSRLTFKIMRPRCLYQQSRELKFCWNLTTHSVDVKRVVVKSPFAAMADFTKGSWPGRTYNESDWNDVTYDYAKSSDVATAYVASKALAEKAAWKFVEERKPHFDLSVLLPPMNIDRFLSGELQDVPDTSFWRFVDVCDLAKAQIRALEVPEAGNERFFIVSGRYSYQKTADVLRASPRIPKADKKKVPVGQPGQNYPGPNIYEIDNSKSRRILGIEYRSFEESIVDSAVKLIELREKASS